MRRLIPFTTLLLLSAAALGAQQPALVGVVRDSSTGRPLPGAVVSIPESRLRTVTDSAGLFRMPGIQSGEHTVFIQHGSFEPWAMRVRLTLGDARDVSLGVIALAPAHHAQIFGTVVDSATGDPLSDAVVTVDDQLLTTRTGADGAFELDGVRSGTHMIRIRSPGYGTWVVSMNFDIPQPMRVNFGAVRMSPAEGVTLEDIVVEGEEFRASLMMRDFMTRMRTEQGTFFTYEDIDRLNPVNTSDLFRAIPGLNAHRSGEVTSGRGSGGLQSLAECTMQYYLDGVKVTASQIDVILPAVIAGVEVYRGSATIPHIFRSQSNANCGVIAVWRKDGGPRE